MLVAYRKIYEGHGLVDLKKFNSTGRWCIQIIDENCWLFLEHKGWIFRHWIREDDIIIQREEQYINTCSTKEK